MKLRALLAFLIAAALASSAHANSLILDATTKSLEIETSAAVATDVVASWADNTTTALTPGSTATAISTATTTTIVAAPAASTQRQIKFLTVRNNSTTVSQTVTLKLDVSGTEFYLRSPVTLGPAETLTIDANGAQTVTTANGMAKNQATDAAGYAGATYAYAKAGTAKDAAGYWVAYGKDAGFPGAYNLGTPGVNGTGTDCSVATSGTDPRGASELGANVLPDPASGNLYLTRADLPLSVTEALTLIDVLWYNTGLTVTTTTAQNITFGTLQARDLNGSSNGEGVQAALLATAALGNAGTISNTTISYTNQSGTAGRTGTFQAVVGWQAPATPVIGTWMPFQLQAGDRGIRSVESVTLATTYTSGSMSLVLFRPLLTQSTTQAGVAVPAGMGTSAYPGTRIYPNSCIWAVSVGNASAANIFGTYTIMER